MIDPAKTPLFGRHLLIKALNPLELQEYFLHLFSALGLAIVVSFGLCLKFDGLNVPCL